MSSHDYLTFTDSIDVLLERRDGTRFSFKEYGIGVRDFMVRSPYYSTDRSNIEGQHGTLSTATLLGYRQIKMSLYFVADSMDDYADKRDEVFQILDSREAFYITESRRPMQRWLVQIDGSFEPDQARIFGFFDVECISDSPYAFSPGTTLSMNQGEYMYAVGGGRIGPSDPIIEYRFSDSEFHVWNDGEMVDPRAPFSQIKIVLQGELNNPVIRNVTTGDEWAWTGSAAPTDVIELDGIRSLKNGQSIFGQTNKKLITLESGYNSFEVNGVDNFNILFDFNFMYLGREPRKWMR